MLLSMKMNQVLGISNDIEPQSSDYYDRNWVALPGYYGDVTWDTIENIVGGDPTLTVILEFLHNFLVRTEPPIQ